MSQKDDLKIAIINALVAANKPLLAKELYAIPSVKRHVVPKPTAPLEEREVKRVAFMLAMEGRIIDTSGRGHPGAKRGDGQPMGMAEAGVGPFASKGASIPVTITTPVPKPSKKGKAPAKITPSTQTITPAPEPEETQREVTTPEVPEVVEPEEPLAPTEHAEVTTAPEGFISISDDIKESDILDAISMHTGKTLNKTEAVYYLTSSSDFTQTTIEVGKIVKNIIKNRTGSEISLSIIYDAIAAFIASAHKTPPAAMIHVDDITDDDIMSGIASYTKKVFEDKKSAIEYMSSLKDKNESYITSNNPLLISAIEKAIENRTNIKAESIIIASAIVNFMKSIPESTPGVVETEWMPIGQAVGQPKAPAMLTKDDITDDDIIKGVNEYSGNIYNKMGAIGYLTMNRVNTPIALNTISLTVAKQVEIRTGLMPAPAIVVSAMLDFIKSAPKPTQAPGQTNMTTADISDADVILAVDNLVSSGKMKRISSTNLSSPSSYKAMTAENIYVQMNSYQDLHVELIKISGINQAGESQVIKDRIAQFLTSHLPLYDEIVSSFHELYTQTQNGIDESIIPFISINALISKIIDYKHSKFGLKAPMFVHNSPVIIEPTEKILRGFITNLTSEPKSSTIKSKAQPGAISPSAVKITPRDILDEDIRNAFIKVKKEQPKYTVFDKDGRSNTDINQIARYIFAYHGAYPSLRDEIIKIKNIKDFHGTEKIVDEAVSAFLVNHIDFDKFIIKGIHTAFPDTRMNGITLSFIKSIKEEGELQRLILQYVDLDVGLPSQSVDYTHAYKNEAVKAAYAQFVSRVTNQPYPGSIILPTPATPTPTTVKTYPILISKSQLKKIEEKMGTTLTFYSGKDYIKRAYDELIKLKNLEDLPDAEKSKTAGTCVGFHISNTVSQSQGRNVTITAINNTIGKRLKPTSTLNEILGIVAGMKKDDIASVILEISSMYHKEFKNYDLETQYIVFVAAKFVFNHNLNPEYDTNSNWLFEFESPLSDFKLTLVDSVTGDTKETTIPTSEQVASPPPATAAPVTPAAPAAPVVPPEPPLVIDTRIETAGENLDSPIFKDRIKKISPYIDELVKYLNTNPDYELVEFSMNLTNNSKLTLSEWELVKLHQQDGTLIWSNIDSNNDKGFYPKLKNILERIDNVPDEQIKARLIEIFATFKSNTNPLPAGEKNIVFNLHKQIINTPITPISKDFDKKLEILKSFSNSPTTKMLIAASKSNRALSSIYEVMLDRMLAVNAEKIQGKGLEITPTKVFFPIPLTAEQQILKNTAMTINGSNIQEVASQVLDLFSLDENQVEKLYSLFLQGKETGADKAFIYIYHNKMIDPLLSSMIKNAVQKA